MQIDKILNDDEKVNLLIKAIYKVMKDICKPNSIKDFGVAKKTFDENLDKLVELA